MGGSRVGQAGVVQARLTAYLLYPEILLGRVDPYP